jgi:hypothetical protein
MAGQGKERLSATAGSVTAKTRGVSSDQNVRQVTATGERYDVSTEHIFLRGEKKSVL